MTANRVYLPKIGWVPFWKSRDIEGTIKNVTVSQARRTLVRVVSDRDGRCRTRCTPSEAAVGIDMGVVMLCRFLGWPTHRTCEFVSQTRSEAGQRTAQAVAQSEILATTGSSKSAR